MKRFSHSPRDYDALYKKYEQEIYETIPVQKCKRNVQSAKIAHCSPRKWKNYKNWYERFIKGCYEPVSKDSDIAEEMYFREANAKCYGLPENFICLNFK